MLLLWKAVYLLLTVSLQIWQTPKRPPGHLWRWGQSFFSLFGGGTPPRHSCVCRGSSLALMWWSGVEPLCPLDYLHSFLTFPSVIFCLLERKTRGGDYHWELTRIFQSKTQMKKKKRTKRQTESLQICRLCYKPGNWNNSVETEARKRKSPTTGPVCKNKDCPG